MHRIGFGYDSHRLSAGRRLVLGGVEIEYDRGLAGHSDADVVLHAIIDAILGAAGAEDIGQLFPETDPQWSGADSSVFVTHALDLAGRAGLRVCNCDVTILAEQPKLGDAKARMKRRIAELLGVDERAVAVKAKTNEAMDAVGRGEGIVAMATVLMSDD